MIADYAELIAEVSERSGVSGVANRADMFTGLAESWLNRHLRVAEMEATTTLTTDADGKADLPANYVKERRVRVGNYNLTKTPIGAMLASSGMVYAIQGGKMIAGCPETDIVLDYYTGIPSLTENSTNWLLELDASVYLKAVLFQVYDSTDDDRAAGAMNALRSLVEDLNHDDAVRRHAGTVTRIGGHTP